MAERFEAWRNGVIPAVPVPFRDDASIDEESLDRYVQWMAAQRVPAVAVGVHTGRGLHLSEEQREHVLRAWQRGGHELVMGVGVPASCVLPSGQSQLTECVIRETVEMAEWARREGVLAVLVYPPSAFHDLPGAEERAIALHEAVAQVGVPTIVFYLYENAGGIDYSDAALDQLLAVDGVIGIKLATLDRPTRFEEVSILVHQHEGRLCITGEDRFYGTSIAMGADVALIGMAAACTDRTVELFDAHRAEDRERFDVLSSAIDAFADATFRDPVDGYVQRMVWALEADSVITQTGRDPFGPAIDPTDRERVHAAVAALRAA
ncbi:MAG: dihydrodipicolinate synthase family protein [Gemmatimonadales bacterium]